MAHIGRRAELIRYGAAAAFLAAATIAALLIRSGINTADRSSTTSTPVAQHVTTTKFVPPAKRRYYRVRPGDTLADIAIRFHTTVSDLKRMNPGVKATALYVHRRLRVK
jgi:LysM repeat protein